MKYEVYDLAPGELEKVAGQQEQFSWFTRQVKRILEWIMGQSAQRPASAETKKIVNNFLRKNGLNYKVYFDKFPVDVFKNKINQVARDADDKQRMIDDLSAIARKADYIKNPMCFKDFNVIVIYGDSPSIAMHEAMHAKQFRDKKFLSSLYNVPGFKTYIEQQASRMAIQELKTDKRTKSGIEYSVLGKAFLSYLISDAIVIALYAARYLTYGR